MHTKYDQYRLSYYTKPSDSCFFRTRERKHGSARRPAQTTTQRRGLASARREALATCPPSRRRIFLAPFARSMPQSDARRRLTSALNISKCEGFSHILRNIAHTRERYSDTDEFGLKRETFASTCAYLLVMRACVLHVNKLYAALSACLALRHSVYRCVRTRHITTKSSSCEYASHSSTI